MLTNVTVPIARKVAAAMKVRAMALCTRGFDLGILPPITRMRLMEIDGALQPAGFGTRDARH
jgi:hypothetical protein